MDQTPADGVHRQHARNTAPAGRAHPRQYRERASSPSVPVVLATRYTAQRRDCDDHDVGNRQRATCSTLVTNRRARRGDDAHTGIFAALISAAHQAASPATQARSPPLAPRGEAQRNNNNNNNNNFYRFNYAKKC